MGSPACFVCTALLGKQGARDLGSSGFLFLLKLKQNIQIMVKHIFVNILFIMSYLALLSQSKSSSGVDIINSYEQRKQHAVSSIFRDYPVRSIGPVVQGGRVSDLAVNQNNVHEYYVAFASGGIFRTEDNGITFDPIFDEQGALGV